MEYTRTSYMENKFDFPNYIKKKKKILCLYAIENIYCPVT